MAKKKAQATPTPEEQKAEQAAAQRLAAIREFNMQNTGELWIDPEKIPTQEDIDWAKKEFEDKTIALRDKRDYLVADKDNALRVAKFLKKFIENCFWTQRYFVGVINFSELITAKIAELEKEPADLVLEYPPLQFCYLMLENYAGKGLEAAKEMAAMNDEYVPIYDTIRDHIEWYNKEAKLCEAYKQRWGMFAQGYWLVLLEESAEQPVEQKEAEVKEA